MALLALLAILIMWAKLAAACNNSEHIRYIQYNNPLSAYTNHIILHTHKFDSMQNTMTLTHQASKWCLMEILEQFCNQKYNYKHILI